MAFQKIEVTLKGISPLLMNRYPMVEPDPPLAKRTPEEQAEHAAYRTNGSENELYVPGTNIQRALVGAAAFSKKGRGTLTKIAAASLFVTPEIISLGVSEYTIDSRPVVIQRARIVRHRPKLDEWQITFTIEYDNVLLKETEVRRIVDDMGQRVGLLDFRPERKGSFGRCVVIEWKK